MSSKKIKHHKEHPTSPIADTDTVLSFFQNTSRYLVLIPIVLMIYIVFALRKDSPLPRPPVTSYLADVPTKSQVDEKFNKIPDIGPGLRSLFQQANAEVLGEDLSPGAPAATGRSSDTQMSQSARVNRQLGGTTTADLDLKGPWICSYTDDQGTKTDLYIQDKQIKISQSSTSGLSQGLVAGDCIYAWNSNTAGDKQCGIGQYVDLLESFMGSGMINIGQMLQSTADQQMGGLQVDQIISSCQKATFDSSIFTVPQGINWQETKLL